MIRFLLIFSIIQIFGFLSKAENKAPFISKVPFHFISAQENKVIGFGKTKHFVGIASRENFENSIDKNVDIYQFKNLKALQLSQSICSEIIQKILGSIQKSSFDLLSNEMRPSKSSGKVCFFSFRNKDPKSLIQEKHFHIKFHKTNIIALGFKYGDPPLPQQLSNDITFTESMR